MTTTNPIRLHGSSPGKRCPMRLSAHVDQGGFIVGAGSHPKRSATGGRPATGFALSRGFGPGAPIPFRVSLEDAERRGRSTSMRDRRIVPATSAVAARDRDISEPGDNRFHDFRQGLPSLGLNPPPASSREEDQFCCVSALHASQRRRGAVGDVQQVVGEIRNV